MAQSLAQIYVHVVFSTKDRHPYLRDSGIRQHVHAYLAGICKNQDCPALCVGGVEDHVHILCRLSKTVDISTLVRELKRDSSKWIQDEFPQLAGFHWQSGYGAFSVSQSNVDEVVNYIANQEEHQVKKVSGTFFEFVSVPRLAPCSRYPSRSSTSPATDSAIIR
jgi:putative transposase